MLKKLKIITIILLCPLCFFAQKQEDVQKIQSEYDLTKLRSLEESLKNKAKKEREEALKMAKQKGWKTVIYDKKGRSMHLRRTENGKPLYYTSYNTDAAISTRTNFLHTGGSLGLNLMGDNMTIYVWEAENGVGNIYHQEFDGSGGNNYPLVIMIQM